MARKTKTEKKHDLLVDRLQSELFVTHDYDRFRKFFEYCRNGFAGEVDLLAIADQIWDFYEVKSNYHNKARRKAEQQYRRFTLAFPRIQTNGFLYCGEGLIRLGSRG